MKGLIERRGRYLCYLLLAVAVILLLANEAIASSLGWPRLPLQIGALVCLLAAGAVWQAVRVPPANRVDAYRDVFGKPQDRQKDEE